MPAVHLPQDPQAAGTYHRLAGQLEASGYDAIWVGEVNDVDAVTAATMAAIGTQNADVGVLLNTFTRAPTTLAMTASTLARVAPGRIYIVLGVASPLLIERWNGIPYRRTHERLRDVLRFLRAALDGDRVHEEFATIASEGFALASPPSSPPSLLIAACGPRALGLAAREADGIVLNWLSPTDLEAVKPLPADRARVSLVVPVCPTADRMVMEATMRPVVADYLQAPAYAAQQRRLGRGDALEPMWKAWAAGARQEARSALPSAVLDDLVVWGNRASCRRRLDEIERLTGGRAIATFFPPPGVSFTEAALAP
jgi:probable F420-dependent oxidoreductase